MVFEESLYENQDFSNEIINEGELDRKEFVACDFTNADFSDVETLYSCKFMECNLSSALLNGVTLKYCAFIRCRIHNANFFATTFEECKLTGSSLLHNDVSVLTIAGGDWSYTDMRGLEFDKKEFKDISFEGADLSDARFTKCRIEGCGFSQAVVNGTSFYQSDIRGSSLNEVDVLSIDMKGTIVDLQQCVVIAEAVGVKYKA